MFVNEDGMMVRVVEGSVGGEEGKGRSTSAHHQIMKRIRQLLLLCIIIYHYCQAMMIASVSSDPVSVNLRAL